MSFWWLGQHGFVLRTRSAVLYIDPFLSDHPDRLFQPPLKGRDVVNADLILGTHDHLDHIDRESLPEMLSASPSAELVVPAVAAADLGVKGFDRSRIHGLDDGKTVTVKGVRISAVKAAHEFFDRHPDLGHPYLSYVIETDGLTILHVGDACIYEGLQSALKRWETFDLAFLPINGRDARRLKANCLGNMTYQEAVDLAGILRPGLTVPAHYEMFAFNSEDPKLFADYMDVKYPDLKYRICSHGERVDLIP